MLFGGQSAEHDVSRATAAHVLNALDPDRFNVTPIGITREGQWVRADDAAARALHALRTRAVGGPAIATGIAVEGDYTASQLPVHHDADDVPTVVLPLLHGPLGEDGTVQGLLELADVAYVGCGVMSSAIAMDKSMMKTVLGAAGVAQPRWRMLREHERSATTATRLADEFGLPVFVKPANMGSSVGVSKASTVSEIETALDMAFEYDELAMIEEAIVGREIEIAVLGNSSPRASLPGEVIPGHDFYDYDDKYLDDSARYLLPAPLSVADTERIRALGVEVFRALRCEGLARVDFFFEEGGRGFLCNEANTMPGFTPISMYPKLWAATGVSYGELLEELVALALERHSRRRRNTKR